MKLEDYSILAWMLTEKIKVEGGEEFNFADHRFWLDPLTDWRPKQVWCKSAQVGGSTVANLKLMFAMKQHGINSIYTLPTDNDVDQFVSSKTNRLIAHNPSLLALTADKDSVYQKRVGRGTAYFRGTMTERAAISVSADLLVHDEVDRSNKKIIEMYASRLQHSKYQWEWIFSNPSTPGNGVDQAWQLSDKKLWFVTCEGCKFAQVLSYEENIDEERGEYYCAECGLTISDFARGHGEWRVTGDPKADWSGYRFSLLFAPWVPAKKIIELKKTKSPDYFANFVLGEPYAGSGGNLTESEFFAGLNTEQFPLEEPVVIGADLGIPNWMIVGNKYGVFSAARTNGYEDIKEALKKWPKSVIVLDAGGDIWGSRQLQEEFPGRVYLCYYRADRKTMKLIDWGKDAESGKVTVDRNRLIQTVIDELRAKKIPLRGTREDWQETWTHFANIYRTTEDDALGQPRSVWERSGPDHLVHALVYWRVAMDKFANFTGLYVNAPTEFKPQRSFRVDPISKGVSAKVLFPDEDEKPEDWRHV